MATLTPAKDKIIVEIISQNEAEDRALKERADKSGFLIPSRDTNDPHRASGPPVMGIVYAIGTGAAAHFKDNIKPGDTVIFDEKKPQGFRWEDKPMLALEADQIVARLERDDV